MNNDNVDVTLEFPVFDNLTGNIEKSVENDEDFDDILYDEEYADGMKEYYENEYGDIKYKLNRDAFDEIKDVAAQLPRFFTNSEIKIKLSEVLYAPYVDVIIISDMADWNVQKYVNFIKLTKNIVDISICGEPKRDYVNLFKITLTFSPYDIIKEEKE